MVRAEIIACSGISEPGVGSNVAEVTCRAQRDGDHYIVTGEKTWISNGHYSDFCMVIVRTSQEGSGAISMILVDRAEHGYESRNIDKLGLNSTSTAQLFFDGARVPAENMMIEPGTGLKNTMVLFEKARPMVGMTSIGIAQAALDKAVAYSKERRQHGKPIGGHQLIQGMLAEAASRPPPVIMSAPFDDNGMRVICYPGDPLHSVPERALLGPTRLRWLQRRFEPLGGFDSWFD